MLGVMAGAAMGVTPGLCSQVVAPESRVTIVSFSYNLVYCLLGGTAPLVASSLILHTQHLAIPGVYLAVISMITFIFLLQFKFRAIDFSHVEL